MDELISALFEGIIEGLVFASPVFALVVLLVIVAIVCGLYFTGCLA